MSAMQHGRTPKAPSTGSTKHEVHKELPAHRTVDQALAHAAALELRLADKVLPFEEDWDLVILANEVKRLRWMIDIP